MAKIPAIEIRTLQLHQLEQLLERARARLDANDCQLLQSLIQTVQQLWQLVEQKDMSLGQLRQLLFGPQTEKTDSVLPGGPAELNTSAPPGSQPEESVEHKKRP